MFLAAFVEGDIHISTERARGAGCNSKAISGSPNERKTCIAAWRKAL
jgi:hypothetical protein